ncbi:MAG: carboxy terminal-processing peptidase [Pirellulales bacterium]|nr:carboxy terminal-processing peptidase [Pirellulales bacterium]
MNYPVCLSNSLRRLRLGAALGLLSLASIFSVCWQPEADARPTPPTANDRKITRLVTRLMQMWHISGRQIDDEIARRCLKTFLQNLDRMKLYFYQSDIDEFLAEGDQIDDAVKQGKTDLAYKIFDRFLQRVDERLAQINIALGMQHDFTLDEELIFDPEVANYPRTSEEAFDRWRKRIKLDLLNETAEGTPMEEAVEKLRRRYTNFAKRMEKTDNDELLEIYLSSLTTGFDPHSSYMSPSSLENFYIIIGLKLEGIGASLTTEDEYGYTVIKKIIPGGAADKDGRLKVEDKIVGVGQGEDGEIVDVVDMKLNDVVEKIRGKAGTVVRLEVITGEGEKRKIYNITRETIELKDSEARSRLIPGNAINLGASSKGNGSVVEKGKEPTSTIFPSGLKPDGTPYLIGVIDLPSFYMDMEGAHQGAANYKRTSDDVRRLLNEFNEKKVDAVIIDLRQNGGGSLPEAVATTGLFIDSGPVVQVKQPDGLVQPYPDPEKGMVWAGPLIVLTSKFSASASEIFAGAIQDYDRGLIIGDKSTHGKGTVQQLRDIAMILYGVDNPPEKLGAVKMTIQHFYRPCGDSTQNRGVVSDIELPSITSYLDIGESDLDYALDFDQVDPLPHENYNLVDQNLITKLRNQSEARWRMSSDFAKEIHDIELYQERKKRKTRTINREKFLAERAELNSDAEEKERIEEMINGDQEIFDPEEYYNAEVLAITLDYLHLLNHRTVPPNHLAD